MARPTLNATARAVALRARLANLTGSPSGVLSTIPLPQGALANATGRAAQLRARLANQTVLLPGGITGLSPSANPAAAPLGGDGGVLLDAAGRAALIRARLAAQAGAPPAAPQQQQQEQQADVAQQPAGQGLRGWLQGNGVQVPTLSSIQNRVSGD